MIAFPNAKLNIGLFITEKRPDGYHNIESCFVPVNWTDVLEILPRDRTELHLTGAAIPGASTDNICLKAWELLHQDFGIAPVAIHLHKAIPTGAGLGGGSADGAFTLKLLNEQFGLGLGQERLQQYAARLGSDCPFFIANQPVIAKGRGEIFEPIDLDLSGLHAVLVNPRLHIGTAEAYSLVQPRKPAFGCADLLARPIEQWREAVVNDFEASAFAKYPALAELKAQLYAAGAVYAAMSGSGSTIYGLFKAQPAYLPDFGDYTVWQGRW